MAHHQLRPYQTQSVTEIRDHFSKGTKKVLLHLATGGGKTIIFCYIMENAAARGKKVIMVVRGRKLVDQAHKRLLEQGVSHGVLMANHWNFNPLAPVQVCSIDTLNARDLYPEADLVVYDEAHYCISKSYHKFVENYPDAYHLAVTATPYTHKSIRHIADVVVKPVTVNELIGMGFLVPPIYYAPTQLDLSKVKISQATKDYVTADLDNILNNSVIVGNLVENWVKFAEQRSTLVFACTVKHSKYIAQMFCDAGIPAEHCDADTKDKEREAIVERLEYGQTKVLVNVGIFCTGVDIPTLGCILMARPTKSYILYIQMGGRGGRPAPGKKDFILLDNAGNVLRHGFLTDEPEASLDGKKPSEKAPGVKTCPKCFAVLSQFEVECGCGFIFGQGGGGERDPEEVDGTLVKLEDMPIEARAFQRLTELKKTRKQRGHKKGWIYLSMKDEFGEDMANKYCPKREVPAWLKM